MSRQGQCRRCGSCCVEAWRFHYLGTWAPGGEIERLELNKVDQEGAGECCASLAWDPETGLAVCTLEDEKPPICRQFPTWPAELLPGCGFHFAGAAP